MSNDTKINVAIIVNNLNFVLGGSDGRMSPYVLRTILSGISVLDSGIVTGTQDLPELSDSIDLLKPTSEVSNTALEYLVRLRKYDKSLIEISKYIDSIQDSMAYLDGVPTFTEMLSMVNAKGEKVNDSSICKSIGKLSQSENRLLCLILLESNNICNQITEWAYTDIPVRFNQNDIVVLCNNIRYLICSLETKKLFNISSIVELRNLLLNIKNIGELYDKLI